jgi:CTP synthase (UTP-ammonia lyase)
MTLSAKEKVSMFCQVDKEHVKKRKEKKRKENKNLYVVFKVICIPDVKTLYRVPLLLEENNVFTFLSTRLNLIEKLNYDRSLMIKWRDLAERFVHLFF